MFFFYLRFGVGFIVFFLLKVDDYFMEGVVLNM